MTKLTDSQLVVLSAAATREDGAAVLPLRMMKAAALKVGASLVARKLMRETRAKPGMPVWRSDEEGRGISLIITKAGLKAINADDAEEMHKAKAKVSCPPTPAGKSNDVSEPQDDCSQQVAQPSGSRATGAEAKRLRVVAPEVTAPNAKRTGSKQAMLIKMLSDNDGATLDAMIAATGWLPHTTRAMLTGLRKKGFTLERVREEGVTTYRITGQLDQAEA